MSATVSQNDTESVQGRTHLSTIKAGRLLVFSVTGLLLAACGLAVYVMQPVSTIRYHHGVPDMYRIQSSHAGTAAGPWAEQLTQFTQDLQDDFGEVRQQQASNDDDVKQMAQTTLQLRDALNQLKEQQQLQQQQQEQQAKPGNTTNQIAHVTQELRDVVSHLKQQQHQLLEQLQQLRTQQQQQQQQQGAASSGPCPTPLGSPSPAPAAAAAAVVPDLSSYVDPVLPAIAKQVLELEKQQVGKRVISVSLFGQDLRYIQGSIENAMLAQRDWPGWTYRVYYGEGVPDDVLVILRAFKAELIRVDMKQEKATSTLWRYYPAADPTVTRFIARDIDARISHRDKAAVDEWIASGLFFHTMHDAPQHTDPILGGLWGSVGGFLNPKFMLPMITNSTGAAWGIDQSWLRVHLWPHVQNYTLDHNAYGCGQFQAAENKGFPIRREGLHDMVGNVHSPPSYIGYTHSGPCPERCRRDPSWEVC